MNTSPSHLLCDIDRELFAVVMDQSTNDGGPLDGQGGYEHVKANTAEAIPLEEHHEKAEADEDHDVYVLEHWGRIKEGGEG